MEEVEVTGRNDGVENAEVEVRTAEVGGIGVESTLGDIETANRSAPLSVAAVP